MYTETTLKTGLIGEIAWLQNEDTTGTQLTGMTTGSSGRHFNDEHPLLTFDNLLSLAPDYTRLTPNDDATVNTRFTAWLKRKTEAGIIKAIDAWLAKKMDRKSARNLLERSQLFETVVSATNLDANQGKYVGFEILRPKTRGLNHRVLEIGLQLTEAQTLDIYLHKATKYDTYEKTAELEYTTPNSLQWFTLPDWNLNEPTNYFIGYKQADLVGQSINGAIDYDYEQGGRYTWPGGKHFTATSFRVYTPAATELWDVKLMEYNYSTNWGMNLRQTLTCDYTDLIVEQKSLFKNAMAKAVAILLLNEMALNPQARTTRHGTNMSRAEILFDIYGDTKGRKSGLQYELDQAIEGITFDTTGIDAVCLPCKPSAVTWTST